MATKSLVPGQSVILSQTPLRITLGGGGTDVMWYSRLKGGAWISAGISKYVLILLAQTEATNLLKIHDLTNVETVTSANEVTNPIIKTALQIAGINSGIGIHVHSEVSEKSGLGGSGAFEVGLLNALFTYKGQPLSQLDLGHLAADLEINQLKKPVGPQDQLITAIGDIHYFELDTNGNVSVEPLALSPQTISDLEHNLLYFSTGIKHNTEAIHGETKKKVEAKNADSNAIIQSLDDIKALGQDVKRWLLAGKVDEFGQSLHEHWLIKKRLGSGVSTAEIDDWYDAGIKAGALGGKIMGSGGGGWFMFYVPKKQQEFRERMAKLGLIEEHVRFDWHGTKIIYNGT